MEIDQKLWEQILKVRRHLHRYPELSMQEYGTAAWLEAFLLEHGVPSVRVGEVGLIATLCLDPAGPVVAIRAEMDALPIPEDTGLPFASRYPGKMHACGHDAIVATAVGVLLYLRDHPETFRGTVRLLFEPAEETGQGAGLLIAGGALDAPKPDALVIFHYANELEEGMEIQKDVSTAAVGGVTIRVRGRSCHFSEREKGVDAILASGTVLQRIQRLQDTFDCGTPFVLGFGLLQGGRKANIMADEVVLKGSLRTFSDESFQRLYDGLSEELAEAEEETGARITLELERKLPAFVNDRELVQIGLRAGRQVYQEAALLGEHPFLVGDNASLYLSRVRGVRIVFFAGKRGEEHAPIHHSRFDIEEEAMKKAVLTLLKFLKEMLV